MTVGSPPTSRSTVPEATRSAVTPELNGQMNIFLSSKTESMDTILSMCRVSGSAGVRQARGSGIVCGDQHVMGSACLSSNE